MKKIMLNVLLVVLVIVFVEHVNGHILLAESDQSSTELEESILDESMEDMVSDDTGEEDSAKQTSDSNEEGSDVESESEESQTESSEQSLELEEKTVSNQEADVQTASEEPEVLLYQKGDRDERLIEIKHQLNHIGFSGILETSFFGAYTEEKVKAFQSYYGLEVTGKVDQATYDYLEAVYTSPQLDSRDERVVTYKEQLNNSGFGGIIVSDYVGNYTIKRLKAFQAYYGLVDNGIFDTVTTKKLSEVSDNVLEIGEISPQIAEYKQLFSSFGLDITDQSDEFTSNLEQELLKLQHIFDLQPNGKFDQPTIQLIEKLTQPIQKYDRDERLSGIKKRLNSLGFGGIIVSDYYGDYAERQVKAFQSANRINVTGVIDGETIVTLHELTDGIMQGDTDERLIEIKKQLNGLGFGPILVTTYFGNYMESQVKAFQDIYNIRVTGILDDQTIDLIKQEFDKPLEKGTRSVELLSIKRQMNRLGFSGILVTTYFGGYFEAKVKAFQEYYGLDVTGIIDERTREVLERESSAPKKGDSDAKILEMKQGLNRLDFSGIIESTYFGAYTEKQLRAFQSYYHLTVNGVYDSRTESKVKEILRSPIQLGESHPSISELKKDLDRLGYGGILVTDYMGSFSEKKLKAFQRDYQLPVTGIADQHTLNVINDAVSNKIARDPGAVVDGYQIYSYSEMVADINRLAFLYPSLISTEVIGQSVDGRDLHAIKLGNGTKEIFFNGSHHAREHMTTNVLMKMVDTYARSYVKMEAYNGYNVRALLDRVSIWFVPMVNPDGVMLVQDGAASAKNPARVKRLNNGSNDFKHWKANINGVDLNRQYPYRWTTIRNAALAPGSENYKGQKPLEAPEAIAIHRFTNSHAFKAAVAYHSTGEVIYTRYGYDAHTKSATETVGKLTGYAPVNLQYDYSGGGYTDWFTANKKAIGMTIEIAPLLIGEPVPLRHWYRVWNDNKAVGLHLARYVVNQGL